MNKKFHQIAFLLSLLAMLSACKSSSESEVTRTFPLQVTEQNLVVQEKVEPSMVFFSTRKTLSKEALKDQTKLIAEQVATTAVKRGKLTISGPLTLVFADLESMSADMLDTTIGFPVKGQKVRFPNYELDRKSEFKCLSVLLDESVKDHKEHWNQLYLLSKKQGYQLSGENRTLIHPGTSGYMAELQLGVQ